MKISIIRSTTAALVLLLTLSIYPSATYANTNYQPSSWSSQKIAISKTAGITPEGFDTQPFNKSITRKDFCELLFNTCRIFGITLPETPAAHPFTDTTDIIAEYSYLLGLTKGTATGIFSPDLPLTREMAAVMLSRMRILFQSTSGNSNENIDWNNIIPQNDYGEDRYYNRKRNNDTSESNYGTVFTTPAGSLDYTQPMDEQQAARILEEYSADSSLVSGWAKTSMADVYTRGILSGTGEGRLDPKSNITREQAALLSLNVLTYCDEFQIRAAGVEECVLPIPAGIFISPSYYRGDVFLRWNTIPLAAAYDVTVLKNGVPSYTARISGNYLDLRTSSTAYNQPSRSSETSDTVNSLYKSIFGSGKEMINAAIEIVPVNSSGNPSVFSLQQEFSISPWANTNERITSDPEKNQFANITEAKQNMTSIEVMVWNLTASGSKKTGSLTLTINKNVAESVKMIFEDIYNGSEKFPIKSCQGYAYRSGTSQHSNGTAIDINPSENYFVSSDGVIKAGTLWKPGNNPYSILSDGDVVRAFNRHGWHWSPDMNWSNGPDYMHFSLTGK